MKNLILLFSVSAVLLFLCECKRGNSTPGSHRIGDFEVTVLPESQGEGDLSILLNATPEMIAYAIPGEKYPNAVNAFLVTSADQMIVFDTGFGNELFTNIEKKGVKVEDVDAVVITHMHGDHVSGLVKDSLATFPNSKIYIARPEFEYWTSEEKMNAMPEEKRGTFMLAQQIGALYGDQIVLFEPGDFRKEKVEILPGVSALAAYGHTPGHTVYLLESGNDKMLIWGDLTHAMAIQMPYPEVSVTYDVDPVAAAASRQAVLKYVSVNNIHVAGMHVAFPGMGKVTKATGNHAYNFTPYN